MYRVYSSDGFQLLGEFPRETAALAAIAEQRWGFFTLEYPSGKVRSVPASGERGGRETFSRARARHVQSMFSQKTLPARLDTDRSARPLTAIVQYRNVSPSGRVSPPSPYQDRRGTRHVHPPGPRKCPKCGV
jgi:hypothetical protein